MTIRSSSTCWNQFDSTVLQSPILWTIINRIEHTYRWIQHNSMKQPSMFRIKSCVCVNFSEKNNRDKMCKEVQAGKQFGLHYCGNKQYLYQGESISAYDLQSIDPVAHLAMPKQYL